tara:strand:- start:1573 stop:1740 length:168 start_codon:yes stop_codon:yes gene_type:complete
MTFQKDARKAWKDSKAFANKHPVMSLLLGATALYTVANIYFTTFVFTKAFEQGNQ